MIAVSLTFSSSIFSSDRQQQPVENLDQSQIFQKSEQQKTSSIPKINNIDQPCCNWKQKLDKINNGFFGNYCPYFSNKIFLTGLFIAFNMYKNGGFNRVTFADARKNILYPFLIGWGIEKSLKGLASHGLENIKSLSCYFEKSLSFSKSLIYPKKSEQDINLFRFLIPNLFAGAALLSYFYGDKIVSFAPLALKNIFAKAPSKEAFAFFLYGVGNLGKHVILQPAVRVKTEINPN